MTKELKQPAWPHDVQNLRVAVSALKALKHKKQIARRSYYHVIVAIDALWACLMDQLPGISIANRSILFAETEADFAAYFRPAALGIAEEAAVS